jgi:dipeptidase
MKIGFVSTALAVLAAAACPARACTSWVILPEASRSGNMIIQKVLDNPYSPLDADFRVAPNGWRWLRIGRYGGPSVAINEKGVAITTNTGDHWSPAARKLDDERHWFDSFGLEWQVVKNCATAEEGVEALKNLARNGLFNYSRGRSNMGTNVLVADAKRAFALELATGYCEAAELTCGMHVIANAWRLPGGESISISSMTDTITNRTRDACARKALQEGMIDGKYTLRGCFAASRMVRGRKYAERYVFVPGSRKARNMSLLSGCFEIDAEFPACLSCAYTALGPPRHTVFLPIPMAVRQLPDKMRDGRWAQMAFDHQEAFGPEHGDLRKIVELEDRFLTEFAATREEARRLLKAGKKDEAVKLLNNTFERHYAEADAVLTELQRSAQAKR